MNSNQKTYNSDVYSFNYNESPSNLSENSAKYKQYPIYLMQFYSKAKHFSFNLEQFSINLSEHSSNFRQYSTNFPLNSLKEYYFCSNVSPYSNNLHQNSNNLINTPIYIYQFPILFDESRFGDYQSHKRIIVNKKGVQS